MSPTMRALQITAYGVPLALNNVPCPVAAGESVLVRVASCGMCHSDLHIHSGGFTIGGGQTQSVAGSHALPFTLGHEIEGVIEAIGPDAQLPAGLGVGSRVAVYPWIGCGVCPACLRGEENICSESAALGIRNPGGYAEYVLVPRGRYLLAADGLPAGQAGLLMCSGLTAYAALLRLRLAQAQAPWLLIGAGGVGLTALSLASAMGLPAPTVADPNPAARDAALAAGAAGAFDPTDAAALAEAVAGSGDGFAGVVDFVGSDSTVTLALGSARKGGAVVVVGLYGGLLMLPVLQVVARQVRLEGSFTGTLAQARDLLALVRAGCVAPIPVQRRALAEGAAALDALRARAVVGRVVLGM